MIVMYSAGDIVDMADNILVEFPTVNTINDTRRIFDVSTFKLAVLEDEGKKKSANKVRFT